MTNIFDQKENFGKRFVLGGEFEFNDSESCYYLIIYDFAWWIQNERDIYKWMETHLPKGRMHHEGMVISMPSADLVTRFLLEWG